MMMLTPRLIITNERTRMTATNLRAAGYGHTSSEGQPSSVVIDATVANRQAEFRVTDRTPGFAWPKRPALPDANSESGRGIFLIQSLMTSTEYVRGENGNVLILRKAL